MLGARLLNCWWIDAIIQLAMKESGGVFGDTASLGNKPSPPTNLESRRDSPPLERSQGP